MNVRTLACAAAAATTSLFVIAAPGLASPPIGQASTPASALAGGAEADPTQSRAAGARWLVQHQNSDGGWGAGPLGSDVRGATSDVATTSIAVMALLRDAKGSTVHRDAIERGITFVVAAVEGSTLQGAQLQGPQGTQPQRKLGQNVDTHFAALLLGDVPSGMPEQLRSRAGKAYDKVLTKVVAAQRADGSFDSDGWAPVLSSSVAARSLNRANELGKQIAPEVLARSDEYQSRLVDRETGDFDASAGAGVGLYAAAASLIGNRQAADRVGAPERERAEQAAAKTAAAVRADRGALVAGFGSIGGEEMLSYMMISDSMVDAGGDDWEQWQNKIGRQLVAIQNNDGSWSGHHCITSTPFVTAAAVMTLGSGDVGKPIAAVQQR